MHYIRERFIVAIYLKEGKVQEDIQKDDAKVSEIVRNTIEMIENDGDQAVRSLSKKFDNWSPESFRLSDEQIEDIVASIPEQTKIDIKFAQDNIRQFAEIQKASMKDVEEETMPGVI